MPAHPFPAIHASHSGCWLRDASGQTRAVGKGDAIMAAADTPLLLLNAPLVANRLGYPDLSGLDLLELYAFVHPARFVVPTPKGLAAALGLPEPAGDAEVPELLQRAAEALLATCRDPAWPEREGAWTALQSLVRLRWPARGSAIVPAAPSGSRRSPRPCSASCGTRAPRPGRNTAPTARARW
jgi:ATP-dependent DNA helicase DinG